MYYLMTGGYTKASGSVYNINRNPFDTMPYDWNHFSNDSVVFFVV